MSEAVLRLTPRWYVLKKHDVQRQFWESQKRFIIVPAGRRSGKTEIAKRRIVRAAMTSPYPDGWYVLAAPTHDQARGIFWKDIKAMVPKWAIRKISETYRTITLHTGVEITVLGLDKPERIEGRPLDGIVLDEFANMKPKTWTDNIRPALDTVTPASTTESGAPIPERKGNGWAILIGVPEGRNHYYDLWVDAIGDPDWDAFTWKSVEILPEEVVAAARRKLDPRTFEQEYEASFVNFEGRAYYGFELTKHLQTGLVYDPRAPLDFSFDFNVAPGVAVISQEQVYEGRRSDVEDEITACIGEVYIPIHSRTELVCKRLIHDWGEHDGRIRLFGDATGGATHSSQGSDGSDWEIVQRIIGDHYGYDRVFNRVPKSNPTERARVNAVNTRLLNFDEKMSMLLDPEACPWLAKDLDSVTLLKGGSGELDKKADERLTHISDAIGYRIVADYPVDSVVESAVTLLK